SSPSPGAGSPPRTWGRRVAAVRERVLCRFTPTHVGTARCARTTPTRPTVHPHARGDGLKLDDFNAEQGGSPPRTWGRQVRYGARERPDRFTPTHVGTALRTWRYAAGSPVHPHARGDG